MLTSIATEQNNSSADYFARYLSLNLQLRCLKLPILQDGMFGGIQVWNETDVNFQIFTMINAQKCEQSEGNFD